MCVCFSEIWWRATIQNLELLSYICLQINIHLKCDEQRTKIKTVSHPKCKCTKCIWNYLNGMGINRVKCSSHHRNFGLEEWANQSNKTCKVDSTFRLITWISLITINRFVILVYVLDWCYLCAEASLFHLI